MAESITYQLRDGVAWITLRRPDALNAFTSKMFRRLAEFLDRAREDKMVDVVVIIGTGRAFCAGEDLHEALANAAKPLAYQRKEIAALQAITRKIVEHPKVIVAALNGLAVGFGIEMAIACDIRIAARGASFSFPEAQRALFQTNGVLWLLPRLVGAGRAAEWIYTGRRFEAAEALSAGLVSRLVDDAALPEEAERLAQLIRANAPTSVRLAKQVLRRTFDVDLAEMLELETKAALRAIRSPNYAEGLRSFREKRPPKYRSE